MVKTIGNPFSWTAQLLGGAGAHAGAVADRVGGEGRLSDPASQPVVRKITLADLRQALRLGAEDAAAFRADVIFIILLYPIIGIVLTAFAFDRDLIPLIFPLASGFALLGPVAAVGLYEMSRRRAMGQPADWFAGLAVAQSPRFGAIFVLGLCLAAIFGIWLMAAAEIYAATLGPEPPLSLGAFLGDVLTTTSGWAMIVLGTGVGFVFAVVVLALSVVSFPLLLDRRVGLAVAVVTSLRVARQNPVPIAVWGLVVAVSLALASIPLFLGLIYVLPILGHATWHLYTRAVAPG